MKLFADPVLSSHKVHNSFGGNIGG